MSTNVNYFPSRIGRITLMKMLMLMMMKVFILAARWPQAQNFKYEFFRINHFMKKSYTICPSMKGHVKRKKSTAYSGCIKRFPCKAVCLRFDLTTPGRKMTSQAGDQRKLVKR